MANVLIEEQTMSDIADAIREKNGTENTYIPSEMPQAIKDIEDTGVGSRQWWLDICAEKTNFAYMFYNCTSIESIPQMDTSKSTNFAYMFYNCTSIKSIPQMDTSKSTTFDNTFRNCINLTSVPYFNTSVAVLFNSMFNDCTSIESIPQLNLIRANSCNLMFKNCNSLAHISFVPLSIKKSISFAQSSLLTDESIQSIFDGLADRTGQGSQVLTLHKELEVKISDEQKAYVVSKNWQLAFE